VTDAFDVINDRRFELDEIIDTGNDETVVTLQRALGQSSHTGLAFNLPWAAVWTVRGGKAAVSRVTPAKPRLSKPRSCGKTTRAKTRGYARARGPHSGLSQASAE